jgi:hypothetical protein
MESYQAYIEKRGAFSPIKKAPEYLRDLLLQYGQMLLTHRNGHRPKTVRNHLAALVDLGLWAENCGLKVPNDITPYYVENFLRARRWMGWCRNCCSNIHIEACDGCLLHECPQCGSTGKVLEVERQSHDTVRMTASYLRVHFDWLLSERRITSNPVQSKYPILPRQITCYQPELLRVLCAELSRPDVDPIEGVILYLKIFHSLSDAELRRAQMPIRIDIKGKISAIPLIEARHIVVPPPLLSNGRHSRGRSQQRVEFVQGAEAIIDPLFMRFEGQRHRSLSNPVNMHLLVAPSRGRQAGPVGKTFVSQVIRRLSMRVFGVPCQSKILQMTSGVMTVERGGAGCLALMGWEGQRAFVYSWAPRRYVAPGRERRTSGHSERGWI